MYKVTNTLQVMTFVNNYETNIVLNHSTFMCSAIIYKCNFTIGHNPWCNESLFTGVSNENNYLIVNTSQK
jgi:hypothetical protein